jgi:hypothetical protein
MLGGLPSASSVKASIAAWAMPMLTQGNAAANSVIGGMR